MSNPYGEKALASAKANFIMGMFWRCADEASLLPWKDGKRMLHLNRNERSGADQWFSRCLNACRQGNLNENDYNFLHGYPTEAKIDFWYAHRHNAEWNHDDQRCRYEKYDILRCWDKWDGSVKECEHCWRERKRRARVLHFDSHAAQARERLAEPHFAESVLITQYNIAVFYFAQERAINFARVTRAQALDTSSRLST